MVTEWQSSLAVEIEVWEFIILEDHSRHASEMVYYTVET